MGIPEVTQIMVAGQKTGIIGLKEVLEAVAADCGGEADDVLRGQLIERLGKSNYMSPNVLDQYGDAFLREYKKFVGEPFTENREPGYVEIKVLGPGCPNCEKLEQEIMSLMAELKLAADLEHVRDPVAISGYGVMGSPGLIVNGEVKAVGRVPAREKIRQWLLQAASA